jgi:hypothetical protein
MDTRTKRQLAEVLGDAVRHSDWRRDEECEQSALDATGEVSDGYGCFSSSYRTAFYGPVYYIPSLLTFSDYSGGTVERANCEEFLRRYGERPGIVQLYGGYGTTAVAIRRARLRDSDIAEDLASLADYSSLDDEAVSNLEFDLQNEALPEAARDLARELCECGDSDEDCGFCLADDETMRGFVIALGDAANVYPECEDAVSAYFDVRRLAAFVREGAPSWEEKRAAWQRVEAYRLSDGAIYAVA